jgi:hypothetical protein
MVPVSIYEEVKQSQSIYEEIRQSQEELRLAEQALNMADSDFIDVAIHKYNAAMEKYQTLIRRVKRGSGVDGRTT